MAKDEFYVDGAHDDSHLKGADYDYAMDRNFTSPATGGQADINYAGNTASPAEQQLDAYTQDPANLERMREVQTGSAGRRASNRAAQQESAPTSGDKINQHLQFLKETEEYLKK